MKNCNCAACKLRGRNENQDLVEFTELTDEDKEEVKQLLTKILSVPSHGTPKAIVNKEAKGSFNPNHCRLVPLCETHSYCDKYECEHDKRNKY